MLFGVLYFFIPLLGTFEFSLRYFRGGTAWKRIGSSSRTRSSPRR